MRHDRKARTFAVLLQGPAHRITRAALVLIAAAAFTALGSPIAAPAHGEPVAKDARVGGDLKKTRFVADLSKPVDFRVFTLGDPYRVVVDLPEVNFQMPPKLGTRGRGLIRAFRYGLFSPGKSRIVIDVVKPVKVEKAFVQDAANGNPARLVIDLAAISVAEFEKQAARPTVVVGEPPQTQARRDDPDPLARVKKHKPKPRPVVVIDPGHGGIDPGAIGKGGTTEKQVVLAFAKQLKRDLSEVGTLDVFLTRDEDVFIPLAERVDIAHHHNADLFISVHADALAEKYARLVRGATVYTLSEEASDEQARALAAKENRADLIAGMELDETQDEVNMILIDLMRRETKNFSISFGRTMLTKLKGQVALNKKPLRSADFRVLRAPDIPSVLLELGYLTNPEDEKLLTSQKWRAEVSGHIARAVKAFFSKREVSLPN